MMDKKKLEVIAAVVLTLILITLLANIILKEMRRHGTLKPLSGAPVASSGTTGLISTGKTPDMKRDTSVLAWGRDPFVLRESAPTMIDGIDSLRLMGITTGKKGAMIAIINNEMVSTGSYIGKFKVIKILGDRVVVNDGGKNVDLRME